HAEDAKIALQRVDDSADEGDGVSGTQDNQHPARAKRLHAAIRKLEDRRREIGNPDDKAGKARRQIGGNGRRQRGDEQDKGSSGYEAGQGDRTSGEIPHAGPEKRRAEGGGSAAEGDDMRSEG